MTTIFERVATALATISPAVPNALAPYKGATLPDTYIVYQQIDSSPEQAADDQEKQRSYLIQVSIYSRAGLVSLPNVKAAMLAAGFKKSTERQIPQDPGTGHYGLAQDYTYLE